MLKGKLALIFLTTASSELRVCLGGVVILCSQLDTTVALMSMSVSGRVMWALQDDVTTRRWLAQLLINVGPHLHTNQRFQAAGAVGGMTPAGALTGPSMAGANAAATGGGMTVAGASMMGPVGMGMSSIDA